MNMKGSTRDALQEGEGFSMSPDKALCLVCAECGGQANFKTSLVLEYVTISTKYSRIY